MNNAHARWLALALPLALSSACSDAGKDLPATAPAAPPAVAAVPATAAEPSDVSDATSPVPPATDAQALAMVVHKSPSCGCCGAWVEHMRQAGFQVEVRDTANLEPVKARLGVPYGKGSCHTAEVSGYMVEGHVPAADVKRLLAERPDARGLVLPGMPVGSPGMELPDGRTEPYTVELVARDGSVQPFAAH